MQLAMIGLGRMGGNMARRLMRGGHPCVVYARDPESVRKLAGEGATGASSLPDLVAKLHKPRVAWMMIPAGDATEDAGPEADAVGHQLPPWWYFRLCSSTRRSHSSFDTPAI